jgi:undecaprenyl diphosphate synthase
VTTADAVHAAGLDPARLPRHVGIIMDGNGRWARSRGWERVLGHRRGVDAVRAVATESATLGIQRLTLYAFSSENWSRPATEIAVLMALLRDFLIAEEATLHQHRIRLDAIGHLARLPTEVRTELHRVRTATAGYDGLTLVLALSYGGRDELADAARAIAIRAAAGTIDPATIDSTTIQAHLYAPTAPDLDLVIRTAGEHRLSNFLPWQAVYAEYVTTPLCWPDMTGPAFHACLRDYQGRDRRFGGLG